MAIAFVQIDDNSAVGSSTTLAITQSSDPTAGNLIVVSVGWFSSDDTVSGVTDSRGNTYYEADSVAVPGLSDLGVSMWYAYDVNGGAANTVTITWTGGVSYRSGFVYEYSGILTASDPQDQNNSATASTAAITPGSITPTENGELIVVHALDNYGGHTATPDSGWTERADNPNSYGNHIADTVQDTAGAINEGMELSSAQGWGAVVSSFKEQAVAAGSILSQMLNS